MELNKYEDRGLAGGVCGGYILFPQVSTLTLEANGVTVWLTTQSYNRIPLMIRKVANGIIAFKLKNVKEIMSIYDEFVIGLSKEQFMDILKYVFKKNYDFLFMNFDNPWDEVYHKNFNQLVLDV